jgi:hypothetical protein
MTLRDNLSKAKKAAHAVLDRVRAGLAVPQADVLLALIVLGDVE